MSPEEDRTRDIVDSEPMHYQLSYSGSPPPPPPKKKKKKKKPPIKPIYRINVHKNNPTT